MQKEKFILCPVCGNKTRVQIREDTELKNFPLFCPKCHILNNERYMGDALLQKNYTTETLPFRKRRNRGEKPQYYVENSTAIKITDTDLLSAITDRLNELIADPEQVHYTPAVSEPPLELLRLKNEIGRMLDGTMIDKELLKNKIFEYASRQYDELDVGERITMEMSAALLDTGLLSSYSTELVKAIVTAITLHADKGVTLTLKNGQQVRKERSDGAHEHSA